MERENPKEFILKKSEEPEGKKIKGYDFSEGPDYEKIIGAFSTTGMQARNFSEAIEIINEMVESEAFIYLGFTSNMVTSGLRDTFKYLAKNRKVDIMVTTVGGIEEDIIKCKGDFIQGSFEAEGKQLRARGINRTGNIFVPNSRYINFEEFVLPILEDFYERQKKTGKFLTPSELIWKLGERINHEDSIYYWCWKNKIPVFCPAIGDGSLGDMMYFFKSKHEDFVVDMMRDIWELNNTSLGKEKTGMIVLGAGVVKHSICNANLYRNGADFAVYINDANEETGSDSGANPDEAVSWGKIKPDGKAVKVFGDAILLFPFVVAETFSKND